MEGLGDTSGMRSPYPTHLNISFNDLTATANANGVDPLSVRGEKPTHGDIHAHKTVGSHTIGDTYKSATEQSWHIGGRVSLSVTDAPTAGPSRTAKAHEDDDVASVHSSIVPMIGSSADTHSVASSAVNAHMTSEKAKLIAHFTSYAEEHTGDHGYGSCNVHERCRSPTVADLAVADDYTPIKQVAATETLLHEHHDFFLASQHHEQGIPNTHNHLVGETVTLPDPTRKAQHHPADSVTDVPATDVEPALGQAVFSMQNTSAIHSSLHTSHTVAGSRLHLTVPRIVLLALFGILNLITISLIIWQITLHGTHELKQAKRCILGGALGVIIFTTCIMLTLKRVLHEILLMALVVIAIGMMLPWELDGLM